MRGLVARQARHQPRRLLACGLAVLLGVAFVVTVLGLTSTFKATLTRAAAGQVRGADVVVTPPQDALGLSDAQVRAAAAAPGVAGAQALTVGEASAQWRDGTDRVTLATAASLPALRTLELTAGRWPSAPGEAVVDARTAGQADLAPGGHVVVDTVGASGASEGSSAGSAGGPVTATVVGVAELGLGSGLNGRVLLVPDADVRAWTGASPGSVALVARAGTSPEQLRDAVRSTVGGQVTVRTGAEEARQRALDLTGDVDVLRVLLLGFAGIALVVAAIVIANTFAILLAQRSRELALLRCVGATRGQVGRVVLGESLLVGVAASLLGLGLGAAVTAGACAWVGHRWPASHPSLALPPIGLVAAVLVGVVTTLLAAAVPARRAGRIAPLEAMRPASVPAARRAGRVRSSLGLLFVGGGAAGLVLAARTGFDGLPLGMVAGTASLAGVLMAGPVLVPALVRVIGPAFSRRPTGALAVANTLRNPGRAASTVTALLVGICLITLMLVGSATVREAAGAELDAQMPIDAAVAVDPSSAQGLPAAVVAAVGRVPGTAASVALATVEVAPATAAGRGDALVGYAGDSDALGAVLRSGRAPRAGELVVNRHAAAALGGADGRDVLVRLSTAARVGTDGAGSSASAWSAPVRVRLVVSPSAPAPLLSAADVDRWTPQARTTTVWVRALPGTDGTDYLHRLRQVSGGVAGAGTDVAGTNGTLQERETMDQVLTVMLWVVTALLGVALLIAVVGVANTLSLSVLERTRESGVQRALGMTRGQLRLGLAAEALVLAGVASLLGIALGIGYGWAGSTTLLSEAVDHVGLVVPWGRLALVALGAAVAAVAASVLPARRAARVSPTVALAEV